MKKLLVAALMVVLASPAFAAIQNVKVSGDITTTFVDRNNFDLGQTGQTEYAATYPNEFVFSSPEGTANDFNPIGLKKQNVFITQTRLRVDADLSDNVSTEVGLINERAWNAENTPVAAGSTPASSSLSNTSNLDTNVQLYLATLTLREFLYSPLTLTIGRQVFAYGNGLILGNGGVINQGTGNLQYIDQDLTERTAYDGITATLDYKPLTISMIYFKNNQATVNGSLITDKTSSDVYGIDAAYQLSDPMSTLVEGYLFTRINGDQNNSAFNGIAPTTKGDTLYVPGLRASTNPTKDLNVQGEVAWQLGNHPVQPLGGNQINEHRDAFAAQFLATYTVPVMTKYKPVVNAAYTYVSGDKNAVVNYDADHTTSAKTYSAWDPFNETQGSGTIYRSLFPLTNMSIISAGASVNPLEDVTTAFTWSNLWASDSYGLENPLAIFQPDGGANFYYPLTKKDRRGLGNEYDVNITYNYTEDVTFGVILGWYVPGSALSSANKDVASEALANVAVTF